MTRTLLYILLSCVFILDRFSPAVVGIVCVYSRYSFQCFFFVRDSQITLQSITVQQQHVLSVFLNSGQRSLNSALTTKLPTPPCPILSYEPLPYSRRYTFLIKYKRRYLNRYKHSLIPISVSLLHLGHKAEVLMMEGYFCQDKSP